jgi:hypothetical protein
MCAKLIAVAAVVAAIAANPLLALAAGEKPTGTIVAVTEGVVNVKAADGKMYQIKVEDIIAEDLKTGDVVEYELDEGKPLHVKKAAKK